jgi:hypothetical protein
LKTTGPVIVTFIGGAVMLVEFFLKVPALKFWAETFGKWQLVFVAFASALGAANLLRIHANRASQKRGDAVYSYLLLATMLVWIGLGLWRGPSGDQYAFLFNNLLQPLSATLFSVNSFYITTAAYRSFRVRTPEAFLLLVSAIVVMLGNVGIGTVMWKGFPALGGWFMRVPNAAGMRGIIIGAALGAIAISLRVILGLERSQYGGTE